jgi:adenylate cyclase class 2
MKDIEIEIQTRVENVAPLLEFLEKNAEKVFEDHQKDEYYTPAHRDFVETRPIEEWLRIRESGKHSVTYKKWHYNSDGTSNHCDEFETKVDDPDSIRKIFSAIDIKPLITVDKKRQSWNWQDYEVSIDHVEGLGDFVEVEYKGSMKVDPNAKASEMIEFLKTNGVGRVEINYSGYPHMLLFPSEDYFREV